MSSSRKTNNDAASAVSSSSSPSPSPSHFASTSSSSSSTTSSLLSTKHALVLHLDLGIGGAEKLMVNLALAIEATNSNINNYSKDSVSASATISNSNSNSNSSNNSNNGGSVTIYTTHHDPSHCFEETKPGGKLGKCIRVYGDWLPRSLFGNRCTALCSIMRMVYLILVVIWQYHFGGGGTGGGSSGSRKNKYDVIILDGISAPIPLLRLFNVNIPILFYCHFPDKYLCVERQNILKRAYRYFVDSLEELSTFCADMILVNSEFTASMFDQAFALGKAYKPKVLYPTIEEDKDSSSSSNSSYGNKFNKDHQNNKSGSTSNRLSSQQPLLSNQMSYLDDNDYMFLSINRYERKKGIEKAILALDLLRYVPLSQPSSSSPSSSSNSSYNSLSKARQQKTTNILLVIAGGYDSAVSENVEHLQELVAVCESKRISYSIVVMHDQSKHLGLQKSKDFKSPIANNSNSKKHNNNNSSSSSSSSLSSSSSSAAAAVNEVSVVFRVSITNEERRALILNATSMLYTPDNEHFGIVPIEAMYLQLPVVAVGSGGPKETVVPGETGYLCTNDAASFADAMSSAITASVTKVDNKSLRDIMGQKGRQRVLDNFTNRVMAVKLDAYINRCIESKSTRPMMSTWAAVFGVPSSSTVTISSSIEVKENGGNKQTSPFECLRRTLLFRSSVVLGNVLYYHSILTLILLLATKLPLSSSSNNLFEFEAYVRIAQEYKLYLVSFLLILGKSIVEILVICSLFVLYLYRSSPRNYKI